MIKKKNIYIYIYILLVSIIFSGIIGIMNKANAESGESGIGSYSAGGSEFTIADGTGSDESGGNLGGGVVTHGGHAFVWFDQGGWKDGTSPGSKIPPTQGVYHWGDSDVPDVMFNTFFNLLNQEIKASDSAVKGPDNTRTDRLGELREAMVGACRAAIVRQGDRSIGARVVGVAITWNTNNIKYYWQISSDNNAHAHTIRELFKDRGPNSSELADSYGWGTIVNKTKRNDALDDEIWRDYVWRLAKLDNPNNGKDYQIYVIAVTDDWPDEKGELELLKQSS